MTDKRQPDEHGVIPEDEQLDKQRMQAGRQVVEEAWFVLSGNARDAVAFEDELNSSPDKYLSFWSSHLQVEPVAILREPARRLHNFLASAGMLVDHTRSHIDRVYGKHSFREEYQQKMEDAFVSSDLAQFVQDLRNYNLHYALPMSWTELNLSISSEALPTLSGISFSLSTDELLKWNKWSAGAKRFLEAHHGKISMKEM